MNTYKKYLGAFVMESKQKFSHGDEAVITTQRGKEIHVIVWKEVAKLRDGGFYYTVIREDGLTKAEFLKRKAEKRREWADSAAKKSDTFYERSNKDSDFLSLAEPIKVGHHSEKRHRSIIEQANNNMKKCVEFEEKSKDHLEKYETLKSRANNDLSLDNPDCIDKIYDRLRLAEIKKAEAKKNSENSCIMNNRNSEIRRWKKALENAEKLWKITEGE